MAKYMGLRSLIHFVWNFSHTFCMWGHTPLSLRCFSPYFCTVLWVDRRLSRKASTGKNDGEVSSQSPPHTVRLCTVTTPISTKIFNAENRDMQTRFLLLASVVGPEYWRRGAVLRGRLGTGDANVDPGTVSLAAAVLFGIASSVVARTFRIRQTCRAPSDAPNVTLTTDS